MHLTWYEVSFEIGVPTVLVQYGWAMATVLLLAAWLAIRVRRRRKEERRLRIMSSIRRDYFPQGDHPAIEEIRREVDESHQRWKRAMLEDRWRRDGSILLERRKEA